MADYICEILKLSFVLFIFYFLLHLYGFSFWKCNVP